MYKTCIYNKHDTNLEAETLQFSIQIMIPFQVKNLNGNTAGVPNL